VGERLAAGAGHLLRGTLRRPRLPSGVSFGGEGHCHVHPRWQRIGRQ
jgi:hypothetical protein